ncbi:MAG: glycerophosphodiester phosphodiesterase, partial [Firmicutes bacterium]|nr:glycerophosphodiester phosphodiesterase [Bacillota bacterium]
LAALQKAIDQEADYAEIDVAQTKDGVVVVSHDNNLKRISGKDLNIWSSNFADIKDLDIGSWFDPQFKNERIPTLDEAIKLCKGKIHLNIELKPTGHEASLVESTIAVINQNDFADQCVLASLDYPTLEKVATVDPDLKRAYITALAIGDIQKLPVDIYSIESTFVTPELVAAIHRDDKEILAWTVESQELTEKMVKIGVDNIITDDVTQTRKIVDQMIRPRELIDRINDYLFADLLL